MQIVIDIPEKMYKTIIQHLTPTDEGGEPWTPWNAWAVTSAAAIAIKNGTVLPKGHGRLISADSLIEQHKADCEINCSYPKIQRDVMCRACDTGTAIGMLEDAPTVIAAEKKPE